MYSLRFAKNFLIPLAVAVIWVVFYTQAQAALSVKITSPANNAALAACSDVLISAEATKDQADIKNVTFYLNGKILRRVNAAPYEYHWTGLTGGLFTLTAKVIDKNSNEANSDPVVVNVDNTAEGDVIKNGEFNCKPTPWTLWLNTGAIAVYEIWNDFYFNDSSYAAITIEDGSDTNWHIQFLQDVPLDSGYNYEISFQADADKEKPIAIEFQQNGGDWLVHYWMDITVTQYGLYGPYVFNCLVNDPTAQFKFCFGANDYDIFLDDVKMIRTSMTDVQNRDVSSTPEGYQLYQNFPNPFNMETTLEYELPQTSQVMLNIFNLQGQKIRTLIQGQERAGRHAANWDGRNDDGSIVSTGIYIYQLQIKNHDKSFTLFRKTALIK
jgi:hypothetical protein